MNFKWLEKFSDSDTTSVWISILRFDDNWTANSFVDVIKPPNIFVPKLLDWINGTMIEREFSELSRRYVVNILFNHFTEHLMIPLRFNVFTRKKSKQLVFSQICKKYVCDFTNYRQKTENRRVSKLTWRWRKDFI